MKLLITCYKLDLSGSSTYTYTLATELTKKGHSVEVFSPFSGSIAKQLEAKDIRVFNRLDKVVNTHYSCIIAQHNMLAMMLREIKLNTPMIFVSHGVLLPRASLEQPPAMDINIQKFIAVSEEVKDNLINNHNICSNDIKIIRNFVDVNKFSPQNEIHEKVENILFLSNHNNSEVLQIIQGACKEIGIKLCFIGGKKNESNVEKFINKADLVISLGRGVLEVMACGRASVVYDYHGGDGIITRSNIGEIRKNNFSGRRFGNKYNINDLIKEIKKYEKSMGQINRGIILKDYNSSAAAERFIKICKEATALFAPKTVRIPHWKCKCTLTFDKIMERIFPTESIRRIYAKRFVNAIRSVS